MTDGEDTVIIGKTQNTASVYHTQHCNTYPSNPREITRGEAQRRGLRPCKTCHNNVERRESVGTPLAKQLEDLDPDDL